jgi:UPF0042 nucleotide-binding protein
MTPVILTGYPASGRAFLLEALKTRGFVCLDRGSPRRIRDFFREHADAEKIVAVLQTGEEAEYFRIFGEPGVPVTTEPPVTTALQLTPALVFLEAGDSVLLERRTAQAAGEPISPEQAAAELAVYRQLLEALRARSALFLNSGLLSVQEEAERVIALAESRPYRVATALHIQSFGYQYGPPPGDVVIDVRFIPNPYYVYSLRPMTGKDEPCAAYVFGFECARKVLDSLEILAETMLNNLLEQGRDACTICIGCTGGQHRSVAVAEALGRKMKTRGHSVSVTHREKEAGHWPAVPYGGLL